jgi:hypothetical protein
MWFELVECGASFKAWNAIRMRAKKKPKLQVETKVAGTHQHSRWDSLTAHIPLYSTVHGA